jgi:hypothetical protein
MKTVTSQHERAGQGAQLPIQLEAPRRAVAARTVKGDPELAHNNIEEMRARLGPVICCLGLPSRRSNISLIAARSPAPSLTRFPSSSYSSAAVVACVERE